MSISSDFTPVWTDEAPRKGSYRSIFKWGDPNGFKHPNQRLYSYIKDELELTDDNFKNRTMRGMKKLSVILRFRSVIIKSKKLKKLSVLKT